MDRSSKAITLALIGSALVLGGCQAQPEEDEWGEDSQAAAGQPQGQAQTQGRSHAGGGVFIVPRIGGGFVGGGGGGGVATAPSARGGFGSTGSASVGS